MNISVQTHQKMQFSQLLARFMSAQLAVWIAIIAVMLLSGIVAPGFLDVDHLLNVVRQASSLAIVTTGQVFVIATGGLDLSNGMVITLVTVIAATLLDGQNTYLVPVVLLCLSIGLAVGLINGLLVTKLRIPPLIGTLGMFGILRGIAYVYTGGAPKGEASEILKMLGNGHLGSIPYAVVCAIPFVALGAILLSKTLFGRRLLVVGANRRTAYLSGIHVDRTVILAYVFSGFSAAAAGLLVAGYIGIGSLSAGNDYNLNSIAAAVIGGTALIGGTGPAGALFLGLVVSLLRFLGLSYSAQLIVEGVILAAAILVQTRTASERSV